MDSFGCRISNSLECGNKTDASTVPCHDFYVRHFHSLSAVLRVYLSRAVMMISELGLTFLGISTPPWWTRGRSRWANCSPLPNYLPYHHRPLRTNKILAFALMSYTHLPASSSSKFQSIIDNALKVYKKRTNVDLLAHPLASQLQACDSSSAIIALLQQRLQGPDQSRSGDDRWIEWLDPTINVLFVFSAKLRANVGTVRPRAWLFLRSVLSYLFGRNSYLEI